MRQQDGHCSLMVNNLGKSKSLDKVVLGSSVLQNFMLEFYPSDPNSYLELSTQKSAMIGTSSK